MNPHIAARLAALVVLAMLALSACETMGMMNASAQTPAQRCEDKEFSVYFDEWQSELTSDARDAIAMVQHQLAGCAIEHVRIVGLAGARGNEADNLDVSMARAQAIAAALEQGGWPADNFELIALGEQNAATAEGVARPMRRRAHIIVQAAPPASS
jgi:outer membrane protein OmpA-like peptidoglycan-associated protein